MELNYKFKYDGTVLEGTSDNGKNIKVIRNEEEKEDIEKAVMMWLLKKEGYNFGDVVNIIKNIKMKRKPVYGDYYFTLYNINAIQYQMFTNSDFDKNNVKYGNYFWTRTEAKKKMAEIIRLLGE